MQRTQTFVEHTINDVTFHLLPEKAFYLPDFNWLIISDFHLGKVAHFRKNGIGIPKQASTQNFDAFQRLMDHYQPNKIIFLGDLFHSEHNESWSNFTNILCNYDNCEAILVKGNHDILPLEYYDKFQVVESLLLNNILFTHEPLDVLNEEVYNICGHIHPGIRLRGQGRQSIKLPCFYFGKYLAMMPAFGVFTGTHTIKPFKGDEVYVVADEEVIKIS